MSRPRVGIVTDSAASLPAELAKEKGIQVVPMYLVAGGRKGTETAFSEEEVLALMESGITTSAPSPGELARAIAAAEQGEGVVVVTVGSRFSASATAARIGADVSSSRVKVIDSGTASGAQALVVLAAAAAAASGGSLEQVAQAAAEVSATTRLVAAVDDLTFLARSGRVPRLAEWAGRRLGVQVLFELSDASAKPLAPALGRAGAFEAVLRTWRRSIVPGARLHVAALHSREVADAQELLARIGEEITPSTSIVTAFSPVMMAHTGPGVRGLAWWWEDA